MQAKALQTMFSSRLCKASFACYIPEKTRQLAFFPWRSEWGVVVHVCHHCEEEDEELGLSMTPHFHLKRSKKKKT